MRLSEQVFAAIARQVQEKPLKRHFIIPTKPCGNIFIARSRNFGMRVIAWWFRCSVSISLKKFSRWAAGRREQMAQQFPGRPLLHPSAALDQ